MIYLMSINGECFMWAWKECIFILLLLDEGLYKSYLDIINGAIQVKYILRDFLPTKANIMLGQQKAPLRPLVTKKVVTMEGGQNQKLQKLGAIMWRCYHQFPEDLLLTWMWE